MIGDRLRELREEKLVEGHFQGSRQLLQCLDVSLRQFLFYEGEEPPKLPNLLKQKTSDDSVWGSSGKHAMYLHRLIKCLSKAAEPNRKLLLATAQRMIACGNRRARAAGA